MWKQNKNIYTKNRFGLWNIQNINRVNKNKTKKAFEYEHKKEISHTMSRDKLTYIAIENESEREREKQSMKYFK